jgi:chorismate mutase
MDKLTEMREEIDALDKQVIALLGKRFQVTEKVGMYKAETALAATDSNREIMQFEKFRQLARQFDIDESLVESLFKLIIANVVAKYRKVTH